MAKGRKTGGRKKGIPNKVSGDLREMIEGALMDSGGKAYLITQARECPASFMKLIGMLLPKDVHHDGTIDLVHRLIIRD